MQFFEAKYVITCEPFPQTYVGSGEMSIKLNDQFPRRAGPVLHL